MNSYPLHQQCDAIVESIDTHKKRFNGFGWFSHFGDYGKNNGLLKKWRKQCEDAVKETVACLKKSIDNFFNQFKRQLDQKDKQIASIKRTLHCVQSWRDNDIKNLNEKCKQYQGQKEYWERQYAVAKEEYAWLKVNHEKVKQEGNQSLNYSSSLQKEYQKQKDTIKKIEQQNNSLSQKFASLLFQKHQLAQKNYNLQEQLKIISKKLTGIKNSEQDKAVTIQCLEKDIQTWKKESAKATKQSQQKTAKINRLLDQLEYYSQTSKHNFSEHSMGPPTQFNEKSPFWNQQQEMENQFAAILKKLPQIPTFESKQSESQNFDMDANNDGKISKEEYINVMKKFGYLDNQQNQDKVDKIFKIYGFDGFIPGDDQEFLQRILRNNQMYFEA